MTEIGIALVALAAGLAVGVAVAALRRPPEPMGSARLEARLEVQSAELRRLADAAAVRDDGAEQVRGEIAGARRVLESLRIREEERRGVEGESREVIRRLATVLAGGAGKGRAGENVLRQHLSELPPSMLACDIRVGGKVVEFGLVLPDGRRLPIDSKWTGLAELEALEAATSAVDREACARAVERAVAVRAREVAQYLDPAITAPVAVAAIPDAAYDVLKRAHADAFAHGVVVVPYSTALPIVLFLYALVQRFGDAADVSASLAEVGTLLGAMEGVLENKFARAATMLANGSDELRSHLGKARGSIARAHAADPTPDPADDLEALSVVR
jgi:DNA recombination protein RmuC